MIVIKPVMVSIVFRPDIDECVSSPCSQKCENVEGSYQCQCYAGFSMNKTTGKCAGLSGRMADLFLL